MPYYADFEHDLPDTCKPKRVIFYQQGLKVYGLIPYILARKLHAQFFSGSVSWGNVRVSMGSLEHNWTAIPYEQTPEKVKMLLDWLYQDKGFEVAIASREDWNDSIFSSNVFRIPPHVWCPIDGGVREGFLQIVGGTEVQRKEVIKLLGMTGKGQHEND